MLILHTKDGSRVGNAILYGGDTVCNPPDYKTTRVFHVETDFGNKMTLTWGELNEMFTVSHVEHYEAWRTERHRLQIGPKEIIAMMGS